MVDFDQALSAPMIIVRMARPDVNLSHGTRNRSGTFTDPTWEDWHVYFLALAVDYDGTIAENGHVAPETSDALSRLRDSGRKLLLVTGREFVDLQHACNDLALFDFIVAENGAVLYDPNTRSEVALAPVLSQTFRGFASGLILP